jgi:prepilin-type N-terminal cleavage/methylation domain-containing protein
MTVSNPAKHEKGFTLIELIIVIGIIGVLASIAIPTFAGYRTRALDTSAKADLRNAAVAQEAYYTDNEVYCLNLDNLEAPPYNFYPTTNVDLNITEADTSGYTMTAVHSASGKVYTLTGPGGSITP